MKYKIIPSCLLLLLFAFSCKKDKDQENQVVFDKKAMLTQIADQIILRNLQNFDNQISQLESSTVLFEGEKNEVNLEALRLTFKNAYLSWQKINPFDFGPMRDNGIKASMNTFPTDTATVEANIQSGSYNLNSASNLVAVGFPALDFLLNRKNALTYFNNANYLAYLKDLVVKMRSETNLMLTGWNSYRATFIAQDGTESTSSFSQLVNEFNRDYELCKNAKVGIPIGKQSLGYVLPEYFEARYSEFSKELLLANIEALKEIYTGSTGVGFDDYLVALDKKELSDKILNQFNAILGSIQGIQNTLLKATDLEPQEVENLYLLLSQQAVHIKTDMTSSFGVLITYQDNDGD